MTEAEKFVPLSRRALRVSRPLAAAVDRALEMKPEARFASAEEMRMALRSLAPTEPEPVRLPPPLPQPVSRTSSRLNVWAIIAGSAALLGLGGMAALVALRMIWLPAPAGTPPQTIEYQEQTVTPALARPILPLLTLAMVMPRQR